MVLSLLLVLLAGVAAIKQPFVTVQYMGNELQACTTRGILGRRSVLAASPSVTFSARMPSWAAPHSWRWPL